MVRNESHFGSRRRRSIARPRDPWRPLAALLHNPWSSSSLDPLVHGTRGARLRLRITLLPSPPWFCCDSGCDSESPAGATCPVIERHDSLLVPIETNASSWCDGVSAAGARGPVGVRQPPPTSWTSTEWTDGLCFPVLAATQSKVSPTLPSKTMDGRVSRGKTGSEQSHPPIEPAAALHGGRPWRLLSL